MTVHTVTEQEQAYLLDFTKNQLGITIAGECTTIEGFLSAVSSASYIKGYKAGHKEKVAEGLNNKDYKKYW